MKATENLDALYLLGLDSRLRDISAKMLLAQAAEVLQALNLYSEARTELDQLRVRIGKDIRKMQEQEGFTNG